MLAAAGLLDRFTSPGGAMLEHDCTAVSDGPGGSGCIVSPGNEPPGRVHWEEGRGYWVGVEDLPVRPQDLQRQVMIDGDGLLLADGCEWRVPRIRRWDRSTLAFVPAVPTSLGVSRGVCQRRVQPAYQAISQAAERIFQTIFDAASTGGDAHLAGAFADAVAFLNVNYRIGLEEASIIGLLDDHTIQCVLLSAIDWYSFVDHARELSEDGLMAAPPGREE